MRQFMRIFIRGALGLTATMVVVAALQAQAAPTGDGRGSQSAQGPAIADRYRQQGLTIPAAATLKPEPLFLAQGTETKKDQPPAAPPRPPAEESLKQMPAPRPQMERMEKKVGKGITINDEPEKAGTRKLGGQTIRAKGTPEGE